MVAGCAAEQEQEQEQEQELKLWRHGLMEPKGDAGFSMMVGPSRMGPPRTRHCWPARSTVSRLDASRVYQAEPEIAELIVVGAEPEIAELIVVGGGDG